jgi:nucleoside-diphosphate-sugar epimerase
MAPGDHDKHCTALIIGCGYLGGRIAAKLLERGFQVTATSRSRERLRSIEELGARPALLELEDCRESPAWSSAYELVVYAVAPGRSGDPRLACRDGPFRCLEALKRPPRIFLYLSTTGVYSQRDGSLIDERSPALPSTPSARLIREAEEMLLRPGSTAAVLRLGGLYGPGRSPLDWLRSEERRARITGAAGAYMNWIRVEDAAEAVVGAGARGRRGEIYLLVDGTPVRRRDFYGLAARLAGVEPPLLSDGVADQGKRCSNRKMLEELGIELRFPDYRLGLAALREEAAFCGEAAS